MVVARKTSDIALLLGSRGRTRGRSGFGKFVETFVGGFGFGSRSSGRSAWREERSPRHPQVSVWVSAVLVLAAFGGGYLVGGKNGGTVKNDLNAKLPAAGPAQPGFLGEFDARPLHKYAFIVAVYPGMAVADAKGAAKTLADWLVAAKLEKTRPYEFPAKDGPLWVVAVYYEGEAEMIATRDRLRALRDVPDTSFVHLQNTEAEWPKAWAVQ